MRRFNNLNCILAGYQEFIKDQIIKYRIDIRKAAPNLMLIRIIFPKVLMPKIYLPIS